MESKRYKLRFLPLFEEDLSEIADYIAHRLHNPEAAEALVDQVQNAIEERSVCAQAFEPWRSGKEREHPYYRIYVRNFTVFYVLIGDVMEVRRILYNKRNFSKDL